MEKSILPKAKNRLTLNGRVSSSTIKTVQDVTLFRAGARHTANFKAQRELSKKKLGSANRAKARLKVARIHAKITDCRLDNLHKLTRELINDN